MYLTHQQDNERGSTAEQAHYCAKPNSKVQYLSDLLSKKMFRLCGAMTRHIPPLYSLIINMIKKNYKKETESI